MTATKSALLAAYRRHLHASGMAWTADPAKLDQFMASVKTTLDGGNTFARDGSCWRAALADVGLHRSVSLKALHALPAGEA